MYILCLVKKLMKQARVCGSYTPQNEKFYDVRLGLKLKDKGLNMNLFFTNFQLQLCSQCFYRIADPVSKIKQFA
jgi:hypothetical protein